ncbi:uncharacterized protein V6R79_014417 [Siganus canaliculatus]
MDHLNSGIKRLRFEAVLANLNSNLVTSFNFGNNIMSVQPAKIGFITSDPGPSGLGLPLMARPAVGVLSVAAQGFKRRGGHENFHPPVLGGGSPPCLPSSERGKSPAPPFSFKIYSPTEGERRCVCGGGGSGGRGSLSSSCSQWS